MPTTLTPIAIKELEELLWNSRRTISEIYREWRSSATVDEMARARGHANLKIVKDYISALRVLFGREQLPHRGHGRQQAINEADYWLKSDSYLSPELTDHLEKILIKADRTNTRRKELYSPPQAPKRSIYSQAKIESKDGAVAGVYVLSKKSFIELNEALGRPLLVKIGWSTNIWERITNAQTFEPDPLEILRVYPCASPNFVEGKFHIVLDTLGCTYEGGGGKEWFEVDLSLIDAIANTLELEDAPRLP